MTPRLFALLAPLLAASPHAAAFDCLLEPRQMVELRSPVEGLIDKVHVERGGAVRKGQVLVELNTTVERATLALASHRAEMSGRLESARNRVVFSKAKMARAAQLVNDSFISTQARDEAQTELRLAESELKDAEENQQQAQLEMRRAAELLEQRLLRSPFDGYVVDRLLNPGDLAESGTGRRPLLRLAQLDPLRVEVVLPQSAYGHIAPGSPARVSVEGQAQPLTASVKLVDRVIDAASGMFGVRLELPNPGQRIPSGARCTIDFPNLAAPAGARKPG
jgi:RND family efflux transporter MFP subunit